MQSLSTMSRDQLACELLAMPIPEAAQCTVEQPGVGSLFPAVSQEQSLRRKLDLACEILQRDLIAPLKRSNVFHAPDDVREWLTLHYCRAEHEIFTVLYLDVKLRLIRTEDLFSGTLTHTSVYPREVVKQALLHNAACLIVAHNHPSGMAEPSEADRLLTRALAQALAVVDISLRDHFVVGCNSVFSFAENGLL